MNATLQLNSSALAFADSVSSSQPSLRCFDWKRNLSAAVSNPESMYLTLDSGETRLLFSETRTAVTAGAWALTRSPLGGGRYRFLNVAAALKTARSVSVTGKVLTLTANPDNTLTLVSGTGTPFAAVVAGDLVMLKGLSTGDSPAVFNSLNEGEWTVLTASNTQLILSRAAGAGVSESVTPASEPILAYANDGVQVGDTVDIAGAFSVSAQRAFAVAAVTPTWFEVVSTTAIAPEAAVTVTTQLTFYGSCKRFLRVEADQDVAILCNGDSVGARCSPWQAGDPAQVAEYVRVGPTWALSIQNRSSYRAGVVVLSAE